MLLVVIPVEAHLQGLVCIRQAVLERRGEEVCQLLTDKIDKVKVIKLTVCGPSAEPGDVGDAWGR